MNKISHPDMNKAKETKASANRPMPQTYVVDDATQPGAAPMQPAQPTIDDRLQQFGSPVGPAEEIKPTRAETKLPKKKAPLTKALEKLIFIGRLNEVVEVGEAKFEVSTLTNREHNEIIQMMYSFTDPADLFMIRLITLANALKTINGISLDSIDIEGEFESDLHRRMSIIDHLQLSVIEKLYDAYERLTTDAEEVSEQSEEVKNS